MFESMEVPNERPSKSRKHETEVEVEDFRWLKVEKNEDVAKLITAIDTKRPKREEDGYAVATLGRESVILYRLTTSAGKHDPYGLRRSQSYKEH